MLKRAFLALALCLVLLALPCALPCAAPAWEATIAHEPDAFPGGVQNAARAADLLNGRVVMPGRVFSFNQAVGARTRARGFVEGPALVGRRMVFNDVGGGICRTSTALYQAALAAGLPVVERHRHSRLLPYAPAGDDAAVWWGKMDLRFRNNTGSPLAVFAQADGKSVAAQLSRPINVHCGDKLIGTGWVRNGEYLLPVRPVAEALGAPVSWTRSSISLAGETLSRDQLVLVGGRAFLPAADLARLLGATWTATADGVVVESR